MNNSVIFFIFYMTVMITHGQSSFIPENLGTAINSTYDEINPVLSPDGKTLYFVRVNHPLNTFGSDDSQDIWYSELHSDGWSPAKRITELNIGRHNAVLSVLDDGKSLLVNGIYNKAGTRWKKRGLSITTMGSSGFWSNPKPIKVYGLSSANSGLKSHASMSADEEFILFSFSRSYRSKKSDIFYSEHMKGKKWSAPKRLKVLSSKSSDDTPFLAPGNNIVYFSSDRKSTGQFDFYRSTKKSADIESWSAPTLMSDTINSTQWEGYLKTNSSGSWGYFSSTNNSMGGSDIYKVKLFEENPIVVVSGSFKHAINKRKLKNKDVKILVNGNPADSVIINKDSATYQLMLPLGHTYSVSTAINSYTSTPVLIDVSGLREFTKMDKDLEASPLPYVLVKGRLLTKSNQTIPPSANPAVRVNGVRIDSAKIDSQLGTYEVKLKHGTTYKMEAAANGFNPVASSLDLLGVDEYKEINLDLIASEEKFAVITGKIIDKKTGKPIRSSVPITIKVEGMKTVWADIDSTQSTYVLRLPVGIPYTISASASNYYPYYEAVDLTLESVNVKIYKDLTIVPIEIGQSIRLNNIFFESGKSALKSESFPELNRVVDFLENNKDIKIEIAGHTDNVGKAAFNQKLSESRAASVAEYIVAHGIASNRIVSHGYGLTKPVASNATKEGKAQNRRVEFTILEF